ncbi:hypothetical protein D1872_254430 [compost metagenome]
MMELPVSPCVNNVFTNRTNCSHKGRSSPSVWRILAIASGVLYSPRIIFAGSPGTMRMRKNTAVITRRMTAAALKTAVASHRYDAVPADFVNVLPDLIISEYALLQSGGFRLAKP